MDMLKIAVFGFSVMVLGAGLTACNKNQGAGAPPASNPQAMPGGSSSGGADMGGASSSSSSGGAAAAPGTGSSSGTAY